MSIPFAGIYSSWPLAQKAYTSRRVLVGKGCAVFSKTFFGQMWKSQQISLKISFMLFRHLQRQQSVWFYFIVKDQMDIYTSASTYVCFMHLWSLLTATVVYRCTCMYRRFLFLNLHAHPNNKQFWKMKLVSAVRHIWHNHFPCII